MSYHRLYLCRLCWQTILRQTTSPSPFKTLKIAWVAGLRETPGGRPRLAAKGLRGLLQTRVVVRVRNVNARARRDVRPSAPRTPAIAVNPKAAVAGMGPVLEAGYYYYYYFILGGLSPP